jgi:CHAT domain-containing protein
MPRASDFVVSSYTPSVAALVRSHSTSNNTSTKSSQTVVCVSQADTPSQAPLPGALVERDILMRKFPNAVTVLDGAHATRTSVLGAMRTHSWIHFACHGIQDIRIPTNSAFELHDGPLKLSELMESQHAVGADLAFLSACQTAVGDKRLPDEAVHLAAGMLAAGYRSVVGTLWSIGDTDAPFVADSFYTRLLLQDGILRNDEKNAFTEPAYALDYAITELRERIGEDEFIRWLPFVHFGI